MSVFLGATFNMGHSWDQMLYFRPHNKFELFDNTYLVGGGTVSREWPADDLRVRPHLVEPHLPQVRNPSS